MTRVTETTTTFRDEPEDHDALMHGTVNKIELTGPVVHVDMQGVTPCLWYVHQYGAPAVTMEAVIIGDGHPYPNGPDGHHWEHVGTTQEPQYGFVWHVIGRYVES